MPKAPTLDPLENFRVIRGVRQFGPLRTSLKIALENEAKLIAISIQKSCKKMNEKLNGFSVDFFNEFH